MVQNIASANGKLHDAHAENGHLSGTNALRLTVTPARHTKVIHLIRHGEGFHNVAGAIDHSNYTDYKYEDAHLTHFGWQQAKALRQHLADPAEPLDIQLIVSSPLTRTLETLAGAFGLREWQAGDAAVPLMRATAEEEGVCTAHPAISSEGLPPVVAWEGCREHYGLHPCDKRRSLCYYKEAFPAVDFSLVEDEEDGLWTPDSRETDAHVAQRGAAFMRWLMQRPETRIAVVSHSSFLYHMLLNFGQGAAPMVQGELHRKFQNCEMRSVVVADPSGGGGLDPAWFPGGKQLQGWKSSGLPLKEAQEQATRQATEAVKGE